MSKKRGFRKGDGNQSASSIMGALKKGLQENSEMLGAMQYVSGTRMYVEVGEPFAALAGCVCSCLYLEGRSRLMVVGQNFTSPLAFEVS